MAPAPKRDEKRDREREREGREKEREVELREREGREREKVEMVLCDTDFKKRLSFWVVVSVNVGKINGWIETKIERKLIYLI